MIVPLNQQHKSVAVWLFIVAGMVWLMALIGAVTRLTESGLSMVEWRPVVGVPPPLTQAEWERVFALYRDTPEFHAFNSKMELPGFKTIFFWEWLHRTWGHLVALSFAAPFLWFWLRRRLPDGLAWKLCGLFALGALQAAAGWLMVLSGLVDSPHVSHYRLALHLGLAAAIFALLAATGWRLLDPGVHPRQRTAARRLRWHVRLAFVAAGLTMLWGALVAGLDAGLAYNTFPDMEGHWLPPEIAALSPWWINPVENPAAVQWIHRCLAMLTVLILLALSWRVWRADLLGFAPPLAAALAVATAGQAALGVATLLSKVAIPLAAAHQGGAFIVLGALTLLACALRPIQSP